MRYTIGLVVAMILAGAVQAEEKPASRWNKRMAEFAAWDKKNTVPTDAVLFVGSSSIVRWETRVAFPDLPVINRGFGGSYLSDVNHHYETVVLPYRPKTIVLYAGDNDVAAGMTPDRIYDEFDRFVTRTKEKFPDTRIIFVAIKPSLARWEMWPTMRAANEKIAKRCAAESHLAYADIATPMLGSDGKPKPDLLVEDKLHLSPSGYALWNKVVGKHIRAESK